MKWIKYKYVCGINADGGEILLKKRVGYSEANLIIAQAEAYNGEYTIEDDGNEDQSSPTFPGYVDINTSAITGGHRITINYADGATKTVDIMDGEDGEKGEPGRGIESIARTSGNGAAGTADTYTVTYTDGATYTFTVWNGKNGVDGIPITIDSIVMSKADGGENKVIFSDGKTLTVMNGSGGRTAYSYACEGGYIGTEEEFAEKLANSVNTNKWAGKIASFLGDSITRGMNTEKTYHAYLQELVGFFACNSYGINGSTIANYYEAMCNRVSAIDDQSDIVFVFGGTNDFNVGIPMGEWYTLNGTTRTVNKNISTFRGALATLCEALLSRFPDKNIVLMTPLHRHTYPDDFAEMEANDKGLYLEDYVDAIKEAGKMYSIPVIDLYAESGLYPRSNASAAIYFHSNDKLHPNAAGHRVIANVIRGFLDRIYPMYAEPEEPTDKPDSVYYSVELNTENCTINNSATQVASGSAYSASVSVGIGYNLESLTVVMDGIDITSSAVNGKYIYIATVTGNIVITAVAVLAYTNLVPIAEERIISGDALTSYDGVGYANNYRLSSSGVIKANPDAIVTGFIPASGGDTIRIGGIQWAVLSGSTNYVCAYKSDYSFIGAVYGSEAGYYGTKIHASCAIDYDIPLSTIKLTDNADIAFIRVSCWNNSPQDGSKLIVTINEEIT